MISLNNFDAPIGGPSSDKAPFDVKACSHKTVSGLSTDETTSFFHSFATQESEKRKFFRQNLVSLRSAWGSTFDSVLLIALSQIVSDCNLRTPAEVQKNRLYLLLDDLSKEPELCEKLKPAPSLICRAFLAQEKRALELLLETHSPKDPEPYESLILFYESTEIIFDEEDLTERRRLFKELFKGYKKAFPVNWPETDKLYSFVNFLGIILSDFSDGQKQWISWAITYHPVKMNVYDRLATKFNEDGLTVGKYLSMREAYSKSSAEKRMQVITDIVSELAFGPFDHPTPALEEVKANYTSLGCRNGWGNDLPEKFKQAWIRSYPVHRVFQSETGNREIWACPLGEFYFSVDCS